MTKPNETHRPTLSDVEFEELWVYWAETYGFATVTARWLALYQYCGGNAFGLLDLSGELTYSPRGKA